MSASHEIRAPAEQTEGTRSQLLRWLKRVGESVEANEPLIELETDKVTVEVASPASGVLAEVLKQEQDEIVPGELLGRIETGAAEIVRGAPAGEAAGAAAASAARAAVPAGSPVPDAGGSAAGRRSAQASPAVQRLLAERGLNAADVQGTGPAGRVTVEDVLRAAAAGKKLSKRR